MIGTAGFTFPFTKGLGYQQFTNVSSNITLGTTAPNNTGGPTAVPTRATYAVILVEGQSFRWLDADTIAANGNNAPSSTVGMLMTAGQAEAIQANFVGLQIAPVVNGGTVNVWYGR